MREKQRGKTYAHDVLDRVILVITPRSQQREPVGAKKTCVTRSVPIRKERADETQSKERTSRWCCPVLLPDIATRRRGSRRLPILKPVFEDRKGRRNLLAYTHTHTRGEAESVSQSSNGMEWGLRRVQVVEEPEEGGGRLGLTSSVPGRVLQDQTLGARDPSCSSSFRRPDFRRLVCDPCCSGCGNTPNCDGRSIFPLDRAGRVILVGARQVRVGILFFFGGSERVEVGRDGGGGFARSSASRRRDTAGCCGGRAGRRRRTCAFRGTLVVLLIRRRCEITLCPSSAPLDRRRVRLPLALLFLPRRWWWRRHVFVDGPARGRRGGCCGRDYDFFDNLGGCGCGRLDDCWPVLGLVDGRRGRGSSGGSCSRWSSSSSSRRCSLAWDCSALAREHSHRLARGVSGRNRTTTTTRPLHGCGCGGGRGAGWTGRRRDCKNIDPQDTSFQAQAQDRVERVRVQVHVVCSFSPISR